MPTPDVTVSSARRVPGLWQQIAASVLTFDASRIEPRAALRCALGVGVPLGVALALHQPGAGVFIAVGAVSVGFGSFQGAYRSRATIMLLASLAMAVSIFVGSLTRTPAAAILLITLWSFTAGMLVTFGPAGGFVGVQATVSVLIAEAYPADLQGALLRALLVIAGGLIQTLFVVSLWPLRRFQYERRGIAEVYRALASYARHSVSARGGAPPDASVAPIVDSLARDPHPFAHGEALVFQALLDEADRIRSSLAALSLVAGDASAALVEATAAVLDDIADAVDEGRSPATWRHELTELDTSAAGVHQPLLDALLGQLRAAWRTAHIPATAQTRAAASARQDQTIRTLPPARDALLSLQANWSLQSATFRHALRLSTAVTLAAAVDQLGRVPRGYWLPMTTLLVLKPEFRETFVTGTARILGTLAGAALATLLVVALGTHHAILAALLLGFVWGGYALFRANYTLFTVCFTGYVVVLLTLSGVAGPIAAQYRALNTLAGGLIGLLVYAMWPTWESGRARDALATLIESLAADAQCLIDAYVNPTDLDADVLRQSRHAARLARSNAEASIERMLAEPERQRRVPAHTAVSVLASARRYALAALALHARIEAHPEPPRSSLAPLRDQIVVSLERLARAVREDVLAESLPGLRRTYLMLPATDTDGIGAELDMMIDSINTMAALLQAT